jgi:TrmH family RNA methyltransferase
MAMKSIISRDNATYKQLMKLAESSRERRKQGKTLLDGVHLLEACLDAGLMPELLVVSESGVDQPEIAALLARLENIPQVQLSQALFAALSPVETPVGILALVSIPLGKPVAHPDLAIMLEDVQDPGNLGTILRSAAAAGVQVAWLSTGCVDAWSPKVLRAGMGAHFALRIVERADLQAQVAAFKGITLAACLDGTSLYTLDLRGPVAFLIGNEGAGLSQALISAASRHFTIPMPGTMESLNAAAAASVCLFERVRQLAAC